MAPFLSYPDIYKITEEGENTVFEIHNDDENEPLLVFFQPMMEMTDADMDFSVSNSDIEQDWLSTLADVEDFYSYRFRVMFKEFAKKSFFKEKYGIEMNYENDKERYRLDLQPGASIRVSLALARNMGFVDFNGNIRAPYRDGRFRLDLSLSRIMFVIMPRQNAWTLYVSPPQGARRRYRPIDYDPISSFSIESNLNIEPWFDGFKKSRVLQWITPTDNIPQGTQEHKVIENIHYHDLHEDRLRELEIVLMVDAEKEVPFYAGTVTVTLHFRNKAHVIP